MLVKVVLTILFITGFQIIIGGFRSGLKSIYWTNNNETDKKYWSLYSVTALPETNIKIDANFDDWVKSSHYPIDKSLEGDYYQSKFDSSDFMGEFMVGFDISKNSLYIAIKIIDDSEFSLGSAWNQRDRIEIYFSDNPTKTEESPEIYRYIYPYTKEESKNKSKKNLRRYCCFEASSSRKGRETKFEARLKFPNEWYTKELSIGDTLGFDLAICDFDSDLSFSWISWSPKPFKIQPNRIGQLIIDE